MNWKRLALVFALTVSALVWSTSPAEACSCDPPPEPSLVFEGVATSHDSARFGEDWTFDVLSEGRGATQSRIVVRVATGDGGSCGVRRPVVDQRYRVETNLGGDGYLPHVNLCGGSLVPLATGELAFPTVNDGDGAAGKPAMLTALGGFALLFFLAVANRRAS